MRRADDNLEGVPDGMAADDGGEGEERERAPGELPDGEPGDDAEGGRAVRM